MISKTAPGVLLLAAIGCGHVVYPTKPVHMSPTQKAPVLDRTYSGSGDWNSPRFNLACSMPSIQVTYNFSGNGNSHKADNFVASLESSDDSNPIVNTIALSGQYSTNVYPEATFGSTGYHLSIESTGRWAFHLVEEC